MIPTHIPTQTSSLTSTEIPSIVPSSHPSMIPSMIPTQTSSFTPTEIPSTVPSSQPSMFPSMIPTQTSSFTPTEIPTIVPSRQPSLLSSIMPTQSKLPSFIPSTVPSVLPSISMTPTQISSFLPTDIPSTVPTDHPSMIPSMIPTQTSSFTPTEIPSTVPTDHPSIFPSMIPTQTRSFSPTEIPSIMPTNHPSIFPSVIPTRSKFPSAIPSIVPSSQPSIFPSMTPSLPIPAFLGFMPIKSSSREWDESDAFAEIEKDLERFGSFLFSEEGQKDEIEVRESFNDYAINREKSVKRISYKGKVFAGLLQKFPHMSNSLRDKIYESMMNIALAINGTYVEMEPEIEGVQMRGWPFKIVSDVLEFEAYQCAHLMEAAALAAEQAALRQDNDIAISLALTIAGAFHDGFLTKDLKRTKVSDDGKVVYVPEGAPSGRKKRFKKVYKKEIGQATYECPEQPQALNHGLAASSAGVGLLRAFGAIGWLKPDSGSRLLWQLFDADGSKIELYDYVVDLKKFLSHSVDLLRESVKTKETASSDNDDNYTGPDGTEWYRWKYRKISQTTCPAFKNDRSNRLEDIDHAKVVLKFAPIIRSLGYDYFGGDSDKFGILDEDIHRFIISVLNRFIIDLKVEVNDRFTCDLSGETDPNLKACAGQRAMPGRVLRVSNLLTIANAARDYPTASCDVLLLIKAVLPIFLEDHRDFHGNTVGQFGYIESWRFMLPPLIAKYYFYWYETGLEICEINKSSLER